MNDHVVGSVQPVSTPQRVQSEALLGKAKELLIIHNGREYRLRQVPAGG